ncbi:hypothetical protein QZH41_014075, partial [Actinostola sp. cb2023]
MLFAVYLLTDTLNWYRLGVLVFLLNLRSTKRNKSRISNPKRFKFSRKGPIKNMACLRWFPKANRAWENSYLCAEGKNDDVKGLKRKSVQSMVPGLPGLPGQNVLSLVLEEHRGVIRPAVTPNHKMAARSALGLNIRVDDVQGCIVVTSAVVNLRIYVCTDGKWSDWRPWAKCTMSCGGGEQQRRRTCSNSFPQNGGKVCEGADIVRRRCNENLCAI